MNSRENKLTEMLGLTEAKETNLLKHIQFSFSFNWKKTTRSSENASQQQTFFF